MMMRTGQTRWLRTRLAALLSPKRRARRGKLQQREVVVEEEEEAAAVEAEGVQEERQQISMR